MCMSTETLLQAILGWRCAGYNLEAATSNASAVAWLMAAPHAARRPVCCSSAMTCMPHHPHSHMSGEALATVPVHTHNAVRTSILMPSGSRKNVE